MVSQVSVARLNVMRALYLLNAILVGAGVVVEFASRREPWGAMLGVAFSFWAALALLCVLGVRYPLAMLPVLFVQLFYKTFWFALAFAPLHAAGRTSDLVPGFLAGIVLDVIAIPWGYAFAHFLRSPAEPWRSGRAA